MSSIALQENEHVIVERGTNPDCWVVRPRMHPDGVICQRGEITANGVGEPTFTNTGYDLCVFGGDEVVDAPACPNCTTGPRNGLVKFGVINEDGETESQAYSEPAPRQFFDRSQSQAGAQISSQPIDQGDSIPQSSSAEVTLTAGCFPLVVRPTVSVCGFAAGCMTISRSAGGDSFSFDIPANLSYEIRFAAVIEACDGSSDPVQVQQSCRLAGGSFVASPIVVPGGHKITGRVTGSVVANCNHEAVFTYEPGSLAVELDAIENSSRAGTEDEEGCNC